jgi:hypothetical protein
MKVKEALTNDECGPLRDELTSAREACVQQRLGYEEENLENFQAP